MWIKCLVLLLFCCSVHAEIISTDRRITWQGNVGYSNGIPDTGGLTIFTNFTSSATALQVSNAVVLCPTNQVIALGAGSYTWKDTLEYYGARPGVILRGATNSDGSPATTITWTNAGTALVLIRTASGYSGLSVDSDLTVTATKGDTTLTVASVPSWVTVGGLIGIDQLDDTNFVQGAGTEGGQSYREIEGQGVRGLGQLNRVLAKTATTITLEIPLFYGFSTAQTAQIFRPGYDPSSVGSARRLGFENINFKGGFSVSGTHTFKIENGDEIFWNNCIIEDIPGGVGVWAFMSYRMHMFRSHIKNASLNGSGQGYGTAWYHVTTACLVENTIFEGLHNAMTVNFGCAGNVWAYNYELNGTSDSGQNPAMNTHGVHTYMNMFEGNYTEDKLLADWTHGSSSHCTVFRNRITGENYVDRKDQRTAVSVEYYNRYWNIVGNVLGNGVQDTYKADSGSTSEGTTGAVLKIGGEVNINLDFTPADANSYTSGSWILVHGNYDTVTGSQAWDSNVADQTLPDSLYLSGKPPWFKSLSWPPFVPSSPNTNQTAYTMIPAGYRYAYGIDPPATTADRGPRIRGIRLRP